MSARKHAFLSLLVLVAMLCLSLPVASQTPETNLDLPEGVSYDGVSVWSIWPHNSSPDDARRIRLAVGWARPGDTIILEPGVFNFGEFDTVAIAKNLTIEGRWDPLRGVPLTRIKGGYLPLCIGRKTPLPKPKVDVVNGHNVYHIDQDVYGKLLFPFAYPPYTDVDGPDYDVFADWTPVNVTVRQITFERPYGAAIFTGAANGGTIERTRVISAWPFDADITGQLDLAFGYAWLSPAGTPVWAGNMETPHVYDQALYTGHDLITGNIVLQDSYVKGDFAAFPEGSTDEAGDVVCVPREGNPTPPNGRYGKYVLQDVALAWGGWTTPDPASILEYWVKKGYYAQYWGFAPTDPYAPGVYACRGVFNPVYSWYANAALTVKGNLFTGAAGMIWLENNGWGDIPATSVIVQNQLKVSTSYFASFNNNVHIANYDGMFVDPYTGETMESDPATSATVKWNDINNQNTWNNWWFNQIDVELPGTIDIRNNRIRLASGSGIAVFWPGHGATVVNNRVSGAACFGIIAGFCDGNVIRNNDLCDFNLNWNQWYGGLAGVEPVEYLLFYANNSLVDAGLYTCGTVYDMGSNNTVIGLNHVFPPEPVSGAQARTAYQPLPHGKK